jgi:hypothetical protein
MHSTLKFIPGISNAVVGLAIGRHYWRGSYFAQNVDVFGQTFLGSPLWVIMFGDVGTAQTTKHRHMNITRVHVTFTPSP